MTLPNPRRFSVTVVTGGIPSTWTCDEIQLQNTELMLFNAVSSTDTAATVVDVQSYDVTTVNAVAVFIADR